MVIFTQTERYLYEDPNISVILKSWLVFYRFGLKNPPIIELMKLDNHRPWRNLDLYWNVPYWCYHPIHTRPVQNTLDVDEARREWDCLLDNWFNLCFVRNHCFEIVETEAMGLGVRTTTPCSFKDLEDSLFGILEPVSLAVFQMLRNVGYPSLHECVNDQDETIHSVLYGPLALCNNADLEVPVAFEHSQFGCDLLLCFTFTYGSVIEEFPADEDIMEITRLYQNLTVTSASFDAHSNAFFPLHATDTTMPGQIDMANGSMVKWVFRCRLAPQINVNRMDNVYVPGQDVYISYMI